MTLTRADGGGHAYVAGHDVERDPAAVRRSIGYVPQASGIDREATGRENLVLQGRLQGMRGHDDERRAAELLDTFGLTDKANALVKTYSGGMKRRMDVAVGLMHRPQVLFLDEPTTGLDPEARAAMWRGVERLAGAERLTILLTTHYLEEADRLAQRVAIVSRGRVVIEGRPEDLKRELRGDAVTVELAADAAQRAIPVVSELPDVLEAIADGRRVHARVEQGALPCRGSSPRSTVPAFRPGRRGLALVARRRLPAPHRTRLPLRRRGGGLSERHRIVTQSGRYFYYFFFPLPPSFIRLGLRGRVLPSYFLTSLKIGSRSGSW